MNGFTKELYRIKAEIDRLKKTVDEILNEGEINEVRNFFGRVINEIHVADTEDQDFGLPVRGSMGYTVLDSSIFDELNDLETILPEMDVPIEKTGTMRAIVYANSGRVVQTRKLITYRSATSFDYATMPATTLHGSYYT